MRLGSAVLASVVGASSLTMWPRNDGISIPPTSSVGSERGLANCPAIRPTLTTGTPEP